MIVATSPANGRTIAAMFVSLRPREIWWGRWACAGLSCRPSACASEAPPERIAPNTESEEMSKAGFLALGREGGKRPGEGILPRARLSLLVEDMPTEVGTPLG